MNDINSLKNYIAGYDFLLTKIEKINTFFLINEREWRFIPDELHFFR